MGEWLTEWNKHMLSSPTKKIGKKVTFSVQYSYYIAALLSLIIFVVVTHAWSLRISIPFFYTQDSIFSSTIIKSIMDTGWYTTNAYIGAPGGFILADFPMAENAHFIVIKLLSYFIHHYAVLFNVFYLLTFPTITLTALFVLKRMHLSYPFALAASLLFALHPYHFFRGEVGHLFLASYYVVPLAVWLSVLIGTNQIVLLSKGRGRLQWIGYFIACLLIGSSGVYYAVFSLFFMVIAGLIAGISHKKYLPILQSVSLCFMISITLIVNLLPSLIYHVQYGSNAEVAARASFESELYGLKITQMLLPIDQDRLPVLARLKNKYNSTAPLITTENRFSTLGLISSIGFLLLLGIILFGVNYSKEINLISQLNLCGVLLSTTGGFGTLFAYTLSPTIRSYGRVSIFIAFFSLYAFFFVAQTLTEKYALFKNGLFNWIFIFLILILGVFNQTNGSFATLQNKDVITDFNQDETVVREIEHLMPKGSMVYQLPYMSFPEHPPIVSMVDYELFRPYLHSHSLKWSYGAMRGRPIAVWQENVERLPISQMIKNLSYGGYNGIFIDRNGYTDRGVEIEQELKTLLNELPMVSDNHYSFFDLRAYTERLKKQESPSLWRKHIKQFQLQSHCSLSWGHGFYPLEHLNDSNWRWGRQKGVLKLANYSHQLIRVALRFKAFTNDSVFSNLLLRGDPILSTSLRVNHEGTSFFSVIDVPPGAHRISFSSDAVRVVAPGEPRQLYFRIQDFSWTIHG